MNPTVTMKPQLSLHLLQPDEILPAPAAAGHDASAPAALHARAYDSGMRRAVSCLVEPCEGDMVLVAQLPDGAGAVQPFVLAILARPGIGDATLSLPDPMAALTLSGQQLRLTAHTRVTLSAPELGLVGRSVSIVSDSFQTITRLATLTGQKFQSFVREHLTVAGSLVQRATTRVSVIEGLDQERSETKIMSSALSTQQVTVGIIQAKDDLRFDGQRVTVG